MQMEVEKPKSSRSLTATLAAPFLPLSVAVLLIAGSFQMYFSFQAQREAVAGKQQLIAQDAANTVASFIQEKFSILEAAVRFGNPASALPEEQKRVLEHLLGLERAFRHLVLLDSQEQELAEVSRLSQAASGSLVDRAERDLFSQVKQGNRYVGSVYVDDVTSEPLVIMAVPATDVFGDFQGTLLAEVNLKFMWDLVDRLEIGETGLAYVVDRQGDLIAFGDIARVLRGENVGNLKEVGEFISNPAPVDETGASISSGINGTAIVGTYVPLGTPDWAVATELPVAEAYREVVRAAVISAGVMLVMAMLAGLIGVNVVRRLAVPLLNLTQTATRIAGGEMGLQAAIEGPTEVASLAKAFNSMAAQLQELIENLEQRVAGRTGEYEEAVMRTQQAYAQLHETHKKLEATAHQAQRRTLQLETAAEVSRTATLVLDPDELVRQAVDLIRERFDLYYVGLFLLDDSGRWAVLRAGTGEAGRQMLKASHRLEVSSQSMVGWCTTNAQARIALDVGEEAVRFDNPLLPETRSEMALPLISRGRVIGVLDVQSVWANAFSDEDIAILQTMADQIAVAIDNARLFAEAQARLEEVQAAHRSYLRESWDEFLPGRETTDYEYVQPGVTLPSDAMLPQVWQVMAQQHTVALSGDGGEKEGQVQPGLVTPITLRGQVIGALGLHEAEGTRQWTDDEIALIEAVADQMALAIENARLFEDARIRAEELAVLNELGQALTARLDVEEVLEEIYRGASRLLDASNFYIALYDPEKDEAAFLLNTSESEIDKQIIVLPASQGLTGYIIHNRKSVLIRENLLEWHEEMGVELVGEPALSWLGVPLLVGDQVLGVMAVQSYTTPRAYDEHDRELLTAIASQSAIAIQNARLFEGTQEALAETRALYEASRAIAAASTIAEVLQAIVDHVITTDVDRCSVLFNNVTTGKVEWMELAAAWDRAGIERGLGVPIGTRLSAKQFPLVGSYSKDESFVVDNAAEDERLEAMMREVIVERMQAQSFAMIPLATPEQGLGILMMTCRSPHTFTNRELRLYQSVADRAAIAIENRRLLEQTQAQARRERLIREITGKVQRSVNLDTILQTTVQELGKALGASHAVVRLGTEAELAMPPVEGQTDSDVG